MSTLLSKLVNCLSERLHSDKCIDCKSHLDYMSLKDDQSSDVLNVKRTIRKTLIKN